MRDPHIEALYYDLVIDPESVTFTNPPPVVWTPSHGRARYELKDGKLTAWPLVHTSTEEEARALVWPDLEAWEAVAELAQLGCSIRFLYRSAYIIDRDPLPQPPGSVMLEGKTLELSVESNFGVLRVGHAKYPSPPVAFNVEADIVRDLMARYRQRSREPLLSLAYALFTRVRYEAGGLRSAAEKYRISQSLLKTISTISTTRGGPLEARKFDKESDLRPLTSAERKWIEKAIKATILQVAAVEAGAEPEPLTMDKLPRL